MEGTKDAKIALVVQWTEQLDSSEIVGGSNPPEGDSLSGLHKIWYIDIPLLPLDYGSNVVHGAELKILVSSDREAPGFT